MTLNILYVIRHIYHIWLEAIPKALGCRIFSLRSDLGKNRAIMFLCAQQCTITLLRGISTGNSYMIARNSAVDNVIPRPWTGNNQIWPHCLHKSWVFLDRQRKRCMRQFCLHMYSLSHKICLNIGFIYLVMHNSDSRTNIIFFLYYHVFSAGRVFLCCPAATSCVWLGVFGGDDTR